MKAQDSFSQPFMRWTEFPLQDGGKAAQKLMQPSPQSVDALKKIMDDARHKAGGPAPAHHKENFNEDDYMDGELMDDEMHVHD